jgi:hypothetical protein
LFQQVGCVFQSENGGFAWFCGSIVFQQTLER